MIKTITKIDIHGNETWQEVYVCNRCKRTLEEDEYVYTTKWQSCFPIKPKGIVATGFSAGSNPDIHICENCNEAVQDFWNGKDINPQNTFPKMTTAQERVDMSLDYYRAQSTEALTEFFHSCMCSVESGKAIEIVLKERHKL